MPCTDNLSPGPPEVHCEGVMARSPRSDGLASSENDARMRALSLGPTYTAHPLMCGYLASASPALRWPLRRSGGERERIAMRDGASAVLHWWSATHSPIRFSERPVVLVVHGITASSDAPAMQYLMRHLEETGFVAVTVNMRGHGLDNPVSAGDTIYGYRMDEDLVVVCEHIRRTRRPPSLYAIGFSVGANQLVCFLGNGGCSLVDAAVSISNPFDFTAIQKLFRHGIPRVVGIGFARTLKHILQIARHHLVGDGLPLSDSQLNEALSCLDVETFDRIVQVPLHGFGDVNEYYVWCSSLHAIPRITIPLLVIHGRDDPLIPVHAFEAARDAARDNPNVFVVATEQGGHMGWSSSHAFSGHSWADGVSARFLKGVFERTQTRRAAVSAGQGAIGAQDHERPDVQAS